MSNNKANEKQLNVPISNLYNFLGDSDYRQSQNYTLGVTYGTNDETGEASVELVKNSLHLGYSLTDFIKNQRFKKAEITLYQQTIVANDEEYCKLGVFRYDDGVYEDCSIANLSELCDYVKIRTPDGDEIVTYTFDITEIVEKAAKENNNTLGLVIKPVSEDLQKESYITVYGEGESEYAPKITITYETNYGVNISYRALSHDLGFFGQGNIDLQYGNLMLDGTDFSWGGGRLPVTIKHLYNSSLCKEPYTQNSSIGLNTADFSAMKLGCGFKLNLMQSIIKVNGDYIYIDENGEEIYLLATDDANIFKSNEDDGELEYNEVERVLKNGDESLFDEAGRLVCITDQNGNKNVITYEDGKITAVTDAVGRKFILAYDDSFLSLITAPDGTKVAFAYTGNYLSSVTYSDGKKAEITYTDDKPTAIILYENEIAVCKTEYTYSAYCTVTEMTEYGAQNGEFVKGDTTSFDYSIASHRTKICKNETETTVCVFDEDGNVISEYLDRDYNRVGATSNGGSENANHEISIVNQLLDHSFESLDNWQMEEDNSSSTEITVCEDEAVAKFGKHYLSIKTAEDGAVRNGVYQETLPGGDDESTFSAYVKIISGFEGKNDGVYLRIYNEELGILAQSEKVKDKFDEFVRISVGEWLSSSSPVKVEILADGKGEVLVDSAQLERNASANAYNLLKDSGFYKQSCWELYNAEYLSENENAFNYSGSIKIEGKLDEKCHAKQTVEVKAIDSTRETFKLSGWANGYGLPVGDNKGGTPPTFRLRAVISYTDGTFCEHTADFNTSVEEWQYASVEFSKNAFKEVEGLQVFCDYDYNYGTAYFDNIELVRTLIETDLSAEDFAEEVEEEDTQEPQTFALKKNDDEQPEETPDFQELLDAFGNTLTETTFTDGEYGTIYRSFGYDEDGNNLLTETDARGNKTEYTVDGVTSRTEEVTDRMGNKTAYEYDKSGRTTKVISKDTNNTELSHVSYKYDAFDNLTEIVRGDGLSYVLKYNAFRDLERIGIDGKADGNLITYTYNTGSGRLKEMTYANGDRMTATYNGSGQMIAEKWYNKYQAQIAYYKYAYDGNGNIVRSIDIKDRKMYNYMYEDGRLTYACESDVQFSEYNYVTRKTPLYVVRYFYDTEGNLAIKRTVFADGKEQTVTYETAENETQLVKTLIGEHSFVSVAKTDSFGRKEFDEIGLSKCSVARKFDYLKGQATDEHIENGKYKSVPTTQLVSKITFQDGRTIEYEYDKEERITKVTDSLDGVTEYTYDALGQLLTETKNSEVKNTMTYDNYGNILTKNGIGYVYNDKWKDRLDFYDGKAITYDEQGNPESYRDHWLIWEKGRQLKFFDDIRYTYNANGSRTSKTVDNVRHDFCLDGAKILRETWNGNTIEPVYDQEDSVCGIIYNQTPYYFVKNLQGDVIEITDQNGKTVARYSYDVWGKCEIDKAYGSSLIAHINPFRYRSYYYDIETGLYYLQSRYYDAETGRFLNGDMAEFAVMQQDALSHNLFGYCQNSCNNHIDPSGYLRVKTWIVSTSLDVLFALLNRYMMAGYMSFSATIWVLARNPFTKRVALNLVQTKVVPVFVRGFFNAALTCLRKVLITFGKIGKEFAKGWTSNKAVNLIDKYLKSRFLDFITSILTWGGIISLVFDILDGKWDGYITIK